MELKTAIKKGSLVAVLGLGLSVGALANTAFAATTTDTNAQKLVDSLKALNLNDTGVSQVYAYLQSVNLSDSEFNQILTNAKEVSTTLNGKDPKTLDTATKTSLANLFLQSVQLAHLQASVVTDGGKTISLTDIASIASLSAGTEGIKIQLSDASGHLLATVDPTVADLSGTALQTKITAIETAVEAKKALEASGTFVPMPSGTLPNTAGHNVDYMMLGGLLVLIGGIAIVPAARFVRKSDGIAQA